MIRILILIPMFLVFSTAKAIHTTNQTVTQDLFVKEYLQDRDKKKNLFSLPNYSSFVSTILPNLKSLSFRKLKALGFKKRSL